MVRRRAARRELANKRFLARLEASKAAAKAAAAKREKERAGAAEDARIRASAEIAVREAGGSPSTVFDFISLHPLCSPQAPEITLKVQSACLFLALLLCVTPGGTAQCGANGRCQGHPPPRRS